MLRYEAVTKRFGPLLALDGITLECASGRTTALLGPSGCGKSTLLRLAVGLVQADAGRVQVDGRTVGGATLEGLRRRIGYVIQEGGLFPHLDVRGNVTLMARHLGWERGRIDDRYRELLELVKLPATVSPRPPDELSGGQRQRVSLMRALMLDPELLLLDEPLGALDPMIRHELQHDLKELFASLNRTVVLVTHDIAEAGVLGDALVLLRAGRIEQQGSLAELLDRPRSAFVREFVASQRGARELLEEQNAAHTRMER
ncbi:MAG TPA: ATP-binding cassette domain-containing protein [Steroidobacteraceae bacterium]|nr:ATP-binding cassette domain-containing protein [Steroidobacteraceae bacterium]